MFILTVKDKYGNVKKYEADILQDAIYTHKMKAPRISDKNSIYIIDSIYDGHTVTLNSKEFDSLDILSYDSLISSDNTKIAWHIFDVYASYDLHACCDYELIKQYCDQLYGVRKFLKVLVNKEER